MSERMSAVDFLNFAKAYQDSNGGKVSAQTINQWSSLIPEGYTARIIVTAEAGRKFGPVSLGGEVVDGF